jgi:hypothetical protein
MSSPRVTKIFEGLAGQLQRMGYKTALDKFGGKPCIRWIGRVDDSAAADAGHDAVVLDLTSATWATANLRAILVASPATDQNDTAALKTQSHAAGHYLDGSVSFKMYMESPANYTSAHAQFFAEMLHVLRGQLGAPVDLWLTANGTQPTVEGVNGAGSTAAATEAKFYLPYGMSYPGGV